MEKFINEKVVVYISKFTNTKVIKALKDGMMFSLPFLMIGSLSYNIKYYWDYWNYHTYSTIIFINKPVQR